MRKLAILAVLGLAIAACGDDPVYTQIPCNTDATCGGYACVMAPGATSGFCTISCATGCADGYGCGTGTNAYACVVGGTDSPPVDAGPNDGACSGTSDCSGYVCTIADGETVGECSTDTCAAGFVLSADGRTCESVTFTCADLACGSYACDPTTNACFTGCTEANVGTNCIEGAQCDELGGVGVCVEVAADPYLYVAVVSRAGVSNPADENPAIDATSNPGPDIDAISISSMGTETFADIVESSNDGAWGVDDGNSRPFGTYAGAVTTKDTVNASGVCDLTLGDNDGTNAGYVCMGGDGGYIVVSFGRELATGDVITVYEVDSNYCAEAATERPDAYDVYVTNSTDDAANPGSSDLIAANWCLVGSSGGNGGVFSQSFNADNCGM